MTLHRAARWLLPLASSLAFVVGGCPEDVVDDELVLPPPRITNVDVPSPVLVGTVLRVSGVDLDRLGDEPTLHGLAGSEEVFSLSKAPGSGDGTLDFRVTRAAIDALGEGTHAVDVVVSGRGLRTERFTLGLVVARELPLALEEDLRGDVHRNDVVVLDGAGFVSATEGELALRVEGTFTRASREPTPVDVRLPMALVSRSDRTRAVVVLSTSLGGLWPGTLEGVARVERTLLDGSTAVTSPRVVSLRFLPPELFSFDGGLASVGRLVAVRGAGFLGGADRPTETTLLRLEGTFTPSEGASRPVGGELVPRFVSGSELRVVVETEVRDGRVVSRFFGAQRGTFEGRATPVTISGRDEVIGASVPVRIVLGPPVQVVRLRFLPGYYQSLRHFGLASAEREIEAAIVRRIEDIYEGFNVDVRLDEPADFDASVTTVIEIGGPDPNGNGLFGYDNSPGKDVGNLRMFDAIGGANAQTQADGFPGYGGVFVESLLWWSEHPGLPGRRPPSSPDPEPLFDEIFDPVRMRPATRAEIDGAASPSRTAEVRRAIEALAAIIGETTAHELGHSLGMAQPYGPPTVFHRDDDGDGCVMDRGSDRPLAERAAQPGAARSRFCDDELDYLRSILGP